MEDSLNILHVGCGTVGGIGVWEGTSEDVPDVDPEVVSVLSL